MNTWPPPALPPTPLLATTPRAELSEGVLGRRVLAFLVDGLVCSVIIGVLWVFMFTFGIFTLGLGLPLLGVLPAVPLLYNWLSVASSLSATPGQRVMGLVVRRDRDFGPPTPLEALVWTIGFVVTISLGVIWFALALLTDRHRTPHDIVSGLVVVRRASLANAKLTAPAPVWNAPPRSTDYV